MRKSNLNNNKQFMFINGALAIGVIAVIFIFLYLSFSLKRDGDKKESYYGSYSIEIAGDFANDSLAIYINDSLLLNRIMPDTVIQLEVKRFSDENVLMVVDKKSDNTSPFNLKKEGSKIEIKKKEGIVLIMESEMPNSKE
ncbi:hypothetical protein [Phocaeicola paurosaccharolyticus]|jgi:hypothetical protein|uniref:hypothetical protein n=1 Tax=Phocaeicola paurosaccharolyticus TaxID=732242 RepID=UPI000468574A|nr:hypothetical protein [Phocaeicola paurosaccharolyticus]